MAMAGVAQNARFSTGINDIDINELKGFVVS